MTGVGGGTFAIVCEGVVGGPSITITMSSVPTTRGASRTRTGR